ncbi:ScbR family autoregulator-binding transcription factor [Streptomyces sp. NPDC005141]
MARQERALRTREALIDSAAAVFDREGYRTASLTAISGRAGVSNGALHFHFASKAALAGAVEQVAAHRLTRITVHGEQQPGRALQCLVDATHQLAATLGGDAVLRAGFALGSEHLYTGERDLRGQWKQWVESTLKRADGEGELAEAVVPHDAVVAVVAATVGFEVLGAQDAEWLSYRTLTRFWRLLLPRLAAPSSLAHLQAAGTRPPHRHSPAAAPDTTADITNTPADITGATTGTPRRHPGP